MSPTVWEIALEAFDELDGVWKVALVYDEEEPKVALTRVEFAEIEGVIIAQDIYQGNEVIGYEWTRYLSEGSDEILGQGCGDNLIGFRADLEKLL